MDTTNKILSLHEFQQLEGLGRKRYCGSNPIKEALVVLTPNTAILFDTHGFYKCKYGKSTGCSLVIMASLVAKKRGLGCTTKHLPDKRVAIAFYDRAASL